MIDIYAPTWGGVLKTLYSLLFYNLLFIVCCFFTFMFSSTWMGVCVSCAFNRYSYGSIVSLLNLNHQGIRCSTPQICYNSTHQNKFAYPSQPRKKGLILVAKEKLRFGFPPCQITHISFKVLLIHIRCWENKYIAEVYIYEMIKHGLELDKSHLTQIVFIFLITTKSGILSQNQLSMPLFSTLLFPSFLRLSHLHL